MIGGSPCTHWSIRQHKNRETEASGIGWELFCQYIRALNEAKPKAFIYENNKSMSTAIRQSITEAFGFDRTEINSSLVSPQHRQRLYWVGIRQPDGTYKKANVIQPQERGLLLCDILDNDNFKALSEKEVDYMVRDTKGKYSDRWAFLQKPAEKDKSMCITANVHKGVPYNICAQPIRVGALPRPNGELSTSQAFRIYSTDGKSVNLTAGGGGAGGKTGLYAIAVEFVGEIPVKVLNETDGKIYTIYRVMNGFITIKDKQYPIKLADGYYIIRKLSVRECKRLQTVPDWYEFPVSDTQSLKMLGNGWTVQVIVHLLNSIYRGDEI